MNVPDSDVGQATNIGSKSAQSEAIAGRLTCNFIAFHQHADVDN